MKRYLCCLLSCLSILSANAVFADAAKQLGLTPQMLKSLKPVSMKPVKRTGKRAANFKKLEAAHLGGNCVLLKLTMDKPLPKTAGVVLYINTDNNLKTGRKDKSHTGVDLMGMFHGGKMGKGIIGLKKVKLKGVGEKDTLWMLFSTPLLIKNNKVIMKLHFLSQEPGKSGNSIAPAVYSIPVNSKLTPPLMNSKVSSKSKKKPRVNTTSTKAEER